MESKEKNLENEVVSEVALEKIITTAVKVPGVKVDRNKFLTEVFSHVEVDLQNVIDNGPISAGVDEKTLRKMASRLILERTAESSLASFAMGIPGGWTMAATIPADALQFYGMTLRLAQELTYIYGAQDMWKDGQVDEELVRSQLILYCGVMFGVSGAVSGVRLLSTQLAKTALKKLPQKALTKTFWYPIVKQIGKFIGLNITKKSLANGVSKVIPVVGGVISGTMTFASMRPMADRLLNTLEHANFHYTNDEFNNDIEIIDSIDGVIDIEITKPEKKSLFEKGKEKVGSLFKKKDNKESDSFEQLKKLKELLDVGAITQDEYDIKKKELLNL